MANTLKDLFAMFPDLPWHRRSSREERQRIVADSVERTRVRARTNVARQKAAADAVKIRVQQRRVRGR